MCFTGEISQIRASKNKMVYSILLISLACGEDEYTCTDERCISEEFRCDGISHCLDHTDEVNCTGYFVCYVWGLAEIR